MALLVSFSVKKGNEGIGVWLHFECVNNSV